MTTSRLVHDPTGMRASLGSHWVDPTLGRRRGECVDAWIILNYACDARCQFCHIEGMTPSRKAVSVVEDQIRLARAHTIGKRIGFSGGEPTLRRDLSELVSFARSLAFTSVHLYTHGRKFADMNYAISLVASGLTSVQISMHGATADRHDRLMGTLGWQKTWRGIRNLAELGVFITINTVAIRENCSDIAQIYEQCADVRPSGAISEYRVTYPAIQRAALRNADVLATYEEVLEAVLPLLVRSSTPTVTTELIPLCLLGDAFPRAVEWAQRDQVDFMIDTNHFETRRIWPGECLNCSERKNCTGLQEAYVRQFGAPEIQALQLT